MKSVAIIIAVLSLFYFALPSSAADPARLSEQARQSVQLQVREMSALGVPEVQARTMLTQMVQNRFEMQTRVRAQQVVMEAARAGLPTEPLMNKAMEGMAKQVQEQKVVAAMETVRNRYAHASRLARSLADDEAVAAALTEDIADSMAAGMAPDDMDAVAAQLQARVQSRQQTRNRAEDHQLAVETMQTVRTTARLGVPSPEVRDLVCQALQNQYTYREMNQLRQRLANRGYGTSVGQAANQYTRAIGKGGSQDGSNPGVGSGGSGGGAGAGAGGGGGAGGGNNGGGSVGSGGRR